jgi:hypothetical protein
VTQAPHQYKTDFNDVDGDGFVTALPGWEGSVLVPRDDEMVLLFDGDGNTCIGLVDHVDSPTGLIFVKPLWDEWKDAVQSTLPSLTDALSELVKAAGDRETRSALRLS